MIFTFSKRFGYSALKLCKRSKFYSTMSKKVIGTHNGTFHCDEVLACYMLKQVDEYKNADIIRTRDPNKLDKCDIIVDVGSVYDPSTHRYDHHQKEFNESFDENHNTRLSSAGLIYKHFGRRVLKNIIGDIDDDSLEKIYQKIYDNFIEGIDGIDNGVPLYPEGVTPAYIISTDLGSRIKHLNPAWNEENVDVDARFREAMEVAGKDLSTFALYYARSWLPARSIVEKAIENRFNIHESGEIIELERSCPWKEHLEEIEKEKGIEGVIKYVIYPDEAENYRVQCVPKAGTSFTNRLSLPEPWRGKRDEELSNISGIPGCIFVHATGFIGGNRTRENAIEMAKVALKFNQ